MSFQICSILFIGALVPITLDFLLDSFVLSTRHLHLAKSAVWLLLLSSLGTNVLIYMYIIPAGETEYWTCTISCHLLLFYMSGLSVLNAYGSHIWKWKYLSPLVFLVSLVAVKRSVKPFLSSDTWANLDIADILCSSIGSDYSMVVIFELKSLSFIDLLPSSTVDNEEEVNTSTNTNIDTDPIRSLVDQLYCSCESAVDVLNDVLVYQSLEQNELIITKKNTAAIPLLRAKIKKITAQH
eukprot:gene2194-4268_t